MIEGVILNFFSLKLNIQTIASFVCFYCYYNIYKFGIFDENGKTSDLWTYSLVLITAIIFV